MVQVSVIMGSTSDSDLGDKCTKMLDELGVSYSLDVISAHRNPAKLDTHIQNSPARVFICIAGLSAALPGAVAARTIRPVIGVPKDAALGGLDALLSIAQMPPGVPVAAMGVNNSRNAAMLAAQILALNDKAVEQKIKNYRLERAK